jgi:protein-tyrosine phosphatase
VTKTHNGLPRDRTQRSIELGTIFGDSAHEILPGLWVGDGESAPMAIARDFAVLNVLETGAIPGESHIPILVPLGYRSPADGVLAYRVRLDEAVKWIEENKSRHKLVHCGAGIERSPLTVAWYMCRRRLVSDLDQAYACLIKQRPAVQDRRIWLSIGLLLVCIRSILRNLTADEQVAAAAGLLPHP